MWIEILRIGTFQDSNGIHHDFSGEKLDEISRLYNSSVENDPTNLAPLVKGHPKHDSPADGLVEKLARRGKSLLAKVGSLSDEIKELSQQKRYGKVSVSLYPDLMLRHVGLLGAASPAVRDLKRVEFNESDKHTGFTIEAGNSVESEAINSSKENRLKGFREFANSLIKSGSGAKILPVDSGLVVDLLEAAHQRDMASASIDFSEGKNLVEQAKEFFKKIPAKLNESIISNESNIEFMEQFDKKNVEKDRLELHKAALKVKAEDPSLSYEEAICQVNKKYQKA